MISTLMIATLVAASQSEPDTAGNEQNHPSLGASLNQQLLSVRLAGPLDESFLRLERDSQAVDLGFMWGNLDAELSKFPDSLHLAHEAQRALVVGSVVGWSGVALTLGGGALMLGALGTGALLGASAIVFPIGLAILATALASAIVAGLFQRAAHGYFFDAVNAYNRGVLRLLDAPGAAPVSAIETGAVLEPEGTAAGPTDPRELRFRFAGSGAHCLQS